MAPDQSLESVPRISRLEQLAGFATDAALSVACYLAAYRLRFQTPELANFLPTVFRALPIVAASQIVALLASGVYAHREGRRWLPRLVGAVFTGTTLGAAVVYVTYGYQGLSRLSFAIDALLLILTAFGWRSGVGLWRLGRVARASRTADGALEDRAARTSVSEGLLGILRHRELLKNLVLRELKLKYRGSVFGFMWSLVNPLVMITVYAVAFRYILQIRTEGFVFLLLLGILAWTLFANSAGMSTGAIVDSGGLIRSVFFPRAILPVATVLFNLAQYLLTVVVFLPLMLIVYRVPPSGPMLLFPVFLGLQVLFTMGVALALAAGTAFFRDVRHILEIALSIMFWTTPIVYEFRNLPEVVKTLIVLSPMSPFVVAYQQIFFYHEWPGLTIWLAAVTYASAGFVGGAALFAACEDRFAEQV